MFGFSRSPSPDHDDKDDPIEWLSIVTAISLELKHKCGTNVELATSTKTAKQESKSPKSYDLTVMRQKRRLSRDEADVTGRSRPRAFSNWDDEGRGEYKTWRQKRWALITSKDPVEEKSYGPFQSPAELQDFHNDLVGFLGSGNSMPWVELVEAVRVKALLVHVGTSHEAAEAWEFGRTEAIAAVVAKAWAQDIRTKEASRMGFKQASQGVKLWRQNEFASDFEGMWEATGMTRLRNAIDEYEYKAMLMRKKFL